MITINDNKAKYEWPHCKQHCIHHSINQQNYEIETFHFVHRVKRDKLHLVCRLQHQQVDYFRQYLKDRNLQMEILKLTHLYNKRQATIEISLYLIKHFRRNYIN